MNRRTGLVISVITAFFKVDILRLFISILLLLTAACGVAALTTRSAKTDEPQKLKVAATIFPLADWLREIGGPDVEVRCLIAGAANAHHYEPSMQDAVFVSDAHAIFAVGGGLDPWASKLAANAASSTRAPFYFDTLNWVASRPLQSILKISMHGIGPVQKCLQGSCDHGHCGHGNTDPHYWLDPRRAITVVERMTAELSRMDPAHAGDFARRSNAYIEKLKVLDAEIESAAKGSKKKTLVTFHDAYGYLFERLNISLAAVVQSSPGIEPSPRDVSEALRAMREANQQAVFGEPAGGPAAGLLAREMNVKLQILDPMDTEFSEAGKTYLERMRHNLKILRPDAATVQN